MATLPTPFGDLNLDRWPIYQGDQLQPWDAADEYILSHLADNKILTGSSTQRVLVINDAYGALACALHSHAVSSWSDSSISHEAVQHNLTQNNLPQRISLVKSIENPTGVFDVVLIKIPKSNALLEDQLIRLRNHITERTVIIAGAMLKHLQKTAFQHIEKNIGPLTTSLAVKKSRLIFSRLQDSSLSLTSPYPDSYTDPDVGMPLINHANVFCRDHLDIGSRFFISHLSKTANANQVVDLACGNGVLGIMYKKAHGGAKLHFIDESYMAIESARINFASAFPDSPDDATFSAQDGLSTNEPGFVDLILCNPPFHQQHAVSIQVANSMFNDAKRCLNSGGQLWLVANHHLGYKDRLKRIFGHCRTAGQNKKFVVLQSTRRDSN